MAKETKPNCPLCGMPLDSRHTLASCQTNQTLFDISMGMHKTKKPDEKKDSGKDNTGAVITSCFLLAVVVYFVIQNL
jgi:hypothetical protein